MHFSGGQDQSVAKFFFVQPQGLLNDIIGDTDAGITGEENEVHSHIRSLFCILQGSLSAAGHRPHIFFRVFRRQNLLHRFQVDADGAAGQFLKLAYHIIRFCFGQAQNMGVLYIKQIQQNNIRTHSRDKFRIGNIPQHGHDGTNRLTGNGPSLAAGNSIQQFMTGYVAEIRALTIQYALH